VSDNDVPVTTESGEAEGAAEGEGAESLDAGAHTNGAPRELTAEERSKLAELDAALAKFLDQKRWSDVIKTTLAKADIVQDHTIKVALLADAGRMYLERSSNQAEAIKCYRRALDLDPSHSEAIEKLKDMYEKRRDWERLVEVMRIECGLLPEEQQPARRVQIALLATERLRKPEICIDLWRDVLSVDAEHPEAVTALIGLYERARDFASLADVLERKVRTTADRTEQLALLQKLGLIYADKLSSDEGAIEAFKRVLELDPEDRRAQEQLKKRFAAAHAWDDLEAFYGARQQWDELIRTLERAADAKEAEVAERITLLFRVARLFQEKLGKPDRAARAYEKVLSLDGESLEAAEALTPIYEQTGDAKKLVGVYEVRLGHIEEADERVVLLREAGLLYEEKLKDAALAFERYLAAFKLDPTRDVIREDLERIAGKTKDWEKLFGAYADVIEDAPSADDAIELRIAYGRVLVNAGRGKDAITQYRAVYEEREDDARAIEALEGLYREVGDSARLLEVLERRAELENEPAARKRLAYDIARLYDTEVGDLDKAIAAYKNIPLEFGEQERDAYTALEELYERSKRFSDLGDLLEHRIDLGPDTDEELAALKFRLGGVLLRHLDDRARALELYREVLTLLPEHEGALAALEGLLADPALGASAAGILEPVYEAKGDWKKLVHALEVSLVSITDPSQRVDVITKVGEIHAERLADGASAFEAYCRALRDAPDSRGIAARLEELAKAEGKVGEMVVVLAELAEETNDPSLARTLWVKAAQLRDEELRDVDGAVAAYSQALALDGGDMEVLGALEALYARTERFRDLLSVLRKKAQNLSEPGAQEGVLAQMAAIYDAKLQDREQAIKLHHEVLELDPGNHSSLAALDDLYERGSQWNEQAENVARQLSMAEQEDARIRLMLRLGMIRELRMGAIDGAIEIYREVIDRDPTNAEAVAALERLLARADHELRVAEILEPLYRDTGETAKLIGVHEIQVRHSEASERRVDLLMRMAELHETALDDLPSAFQCTARALAEDPTNSTTQEQLERLAASTGGWQALAEVIESQLTRVEDPHLAAGLHAKAAEVREVNLGDPRGAIEHYRKVLELDATSLSAVVALERMYQGLERYEDLAAIYLTKASMLDDAAERKRHTFHAGQIYEEVLERPEQAIGVFKAWLTQESDDVEAIDRLIALYLKLSRYEDLLQAYGQKADIASEPDEKKSLYIEIGSVYEHRLRQIDKAIDTYQRILEIDPEDRPALERLDVLYQSTERNEELLSVLEREADLAIDPNAAIAFRFRSGELFELKLNDAFRAVEVYRGILDAMPDHLQAQHALERMIDANKEPVQAASVLEPVYRAAAESQKLVRVLEVLVAADEDPARKVDLLHQVADLHEVHLEQPALAFDAYARALPHDNQNDKTLASIEMFAERLNSWPQLVKLYDAEIARLRGDEPGLAIELALRLAKLCETMIGDVEAAIGRYRIVFEADPGHLEALQALDRLYEQSGRWRELADVLAREAEVAPSPDDVLELQYKLGQVLQHRLGETERAIGQYKEILAAAPEHEGALSALEGLFAQGTSVGAIGEILESLYRMQDAWDKLIGVQQATLGAVGAPDERVATMLRIAEIAEQRLGNLDLAFTWAQRALIEDPAHDHAQSEVERLAGDVDGWAVLASTYAQILGETHPAGLQVVIAKRLSRAFEEELGDVSRAEEAYRYVIALDATDEDALDALDRIYSQNGAGRALAETLKLRVAAATDNRTKVELMHRLGVVLYDQVGNPAEAIEVFNALLEKDAEHEDSIRALQNVYLVTQDWSRLFDAYERELAVVVGDSAQAEIYGRMAMLSWTKLGDLMRAVALLKQVLDLLGEDAEALNALGNIYALQENWTDLVDVLEREVAVADSDESRVRIYADLGRIWYGKLHRDRNALESWERALDIDPAYTDALFAMGEIHRVAGANTELVDTLHRVIDVGTATLDDATIEGVYMQLGAIYETQLSQPPDAIDAYRRALELSPRNFGAMDALERIHGGQEQWEEVIEVMGRRADALDDPREKILVLLETARMWEEKLEARERAVAPFIRVLGIDPLHDAAFAQLEAIFREQARFSELIDLYLARVEATESVEERVSILRRVAQVNERDLGDKNQAFEALQLAWTQDFTNEETARELERITGLTQRWKELLTTANQALADTPESEQPVRNAICVKCARWYAREGHPEYAIPFLQQVLALDPLNLPAMKQMADLYQETQQWPAYSQVLRKLSEMTEDPIERAEVCVRMGQLQEEHLHSAEQAIRNYRAALDTVPKQLDALKALERIHRSRSEWSDLIDVLKKKVEAVDDRSQVMAARLELAEAYEDRVSDKSQAIEQYRGVLAEDAESVQALKGLERLYAQQERWQDLLQVLERQLEISSGDRAQIALLMRIAGMWEEVFRKPDAAAQRLERVIDLDPSFTEALIGLERLYRQLQRWDELVRSIERHIDVTPDRSEKAALYGQMGLVYRDQLEDLERSIESFLSVTAIDERSQSALEALADLYERRSEHGMALDAMDRLTRVLTDADARVQLLHRMGKLYDAQLGDRVAAVDHFQKAIDIDATHLPSLEAMRAIHIAEGDWSAAASVLERATAVEQPARRAAELRVELGTLYQDRLGERERAIECYEDAIKLSSDSAGAALPLVNYYVEAERYRDAEPLLKMLVASTEIPDPGEQQRLWRVYGVVAEKLGDDETAVRAYGEALQLDSQDLDSLTGLASGHYRRKDWENAHKYYQMLLVHRRDDLSSDQITDVHYRLGVIKREQGDLRKALNMFDKALEENDLHKPTLEALVGIHSEQKEWEQVIHYKKRVLDTIDEPDQRFDMYSQIGQHWQVELKNPVKAIEAYVEASSIQPNNHVMLHKMLGLYSETRQWESAIEIIDRISALEERAEVRAKYANTVGVILRDELKNPDSAVDRFDQALDLDPTGALKAFEAINKILTQQKDWKKLERAFRKMLHRTTGKGDKVLEQNLWHNLGVIYRDRLRALDSAAEAFSMAAKLQPDNLQEHVILAELYALMPGRVQDAVNEHQTLLKADPYRVDSYRSLYKLYFDARQYDRAWCVAATLAFLKKADSEHKQFHEQYKPDGPIRPKARLTNERWVKDLYHPDEDYVVGKLFEAVMPSVLRSRAQPDKTWQLRKKDQIPDVMNTTVAFARTFGFATQVLSLPLTPRLFVCPDRQGGLAYATTVPPATVCGSALLSGVNPLEVIFLVGKHLSYYRPEHYIRTMFQTKDELKLVLAASMQIAGVNLGDPNVERWAKDIRANMQPADLELLNSIGKRFVEAGARTDVKQWMRTVELTGCRAGFLLCNNLEIASRMIQAEPPMGAIELSPKEKIEDLLLFSISEQYFRLRESLGIEVQVG
jgi:tetratricopeptide (TPR) repeat protein